MAAKEQKATRSIERKKRTLVYRPTLPGWRHRSPPGADCHWEKWTWSLPKPWGRPLTRPQWTPRCSSCRVLPQCPQPALSVGTFAHSREPCVTHSRGVIPLRRFLRGSNLFHCRLEWYGYLCVHFLSNLYCILSLIECDMMCLLAWTCEIICNVRKSCIGGSFIHEVLDEHVIFSEHQNNTI